MLYVHSSLWLCSRKLPEYLEGPTTWWDVDVEDPTQIDDDEYNPSPNVGLVGIPLDHIAFNLGDDDDDGDDGFAVPSEVEAYMDSLAVEDHTL